MANEVRIPVRLEVLKDSVNDLQGILEHLKPDSSSFKHIVKYLQQMNDEMTRFQALTNSAFSDQAAFNKAGKSIEKMQESLNKANVAIGDLKFSDIKLDASQLKSFQAVETQIKAIKEEFAGIKEQAKQSLLSDNATKDLIGNLNPSYLKKDFDALSKAIDSEVSKLETKLINAQNKLNDALNKKQSKADEINRLTTYGISKEGLGEEVFNRFFQQSKAGLLSFNSRDFKKGEAKQEFLNYLAKQFTLTKADMDSIQAAVKTGSASQFDELFKNMGKSITGNVFTKRLDSNTFGDLNGLRNAVAEAEKAQQELAAVQQKFNDIQGDSGAVGIAAEKYQASLDKLNEELLKLQNNAVNAAQALPQVAKGSSSATSELTQLQSALSQANSKFLALQRTTQNFNQIKMAIVNFMGFRQTLNLVKNAISGALNHIKELDSVMNKISIVTDMSTADLWNQVDAYSKMAQTYGVSIKGAYEVSQIYYQQGLKTNDVLTLTNETLKLAKISGLDYAQTTDYMTTALRGFKLEMSDASKIVDVYSNLSAHTAVSSEELAIAMSKTASSMQSVGSTFEETSAMIGTMVAVTRESSTNIGTALKSIASRYGEMKKDMSAVVDAEGEAISYNKVDAALQSIGISMKTADGQFREFTDVIIELGEKWNELDSVQQRYIATQFAGNRQQSRFLALVSNVDLLKQNIAVAEDSEDTGTLQALKALDSVESKLEQLKVSYQQFYTTVGGETIWKGLLDGARGFVDYLNGLPKLFGKIPVSAIAVIANALGLIKMLAFKVIGEIADVWLERTQKAGENAGDEMGESMSESVRRQVDKMHDVGRELGKAASKGFQEGAAEGANQATSTLINAAVNKGGDVGATVAQQQAQKQTPTTSSVDSQIATQDAMKSTVKDWFSGTFSDVDLDSGKDAIVASVTTAAANASTDLKPALSGVGLDVSVSIAQGILQGMGMAADAAKELSTTILNTIRSTLDIHSPSPTVIAMLKTGIGGATVQALAEAGADAGESAESFGKRLMQALADSIKNGETTIGRLLSGLGEHFAEVAKELEPLLGNTFKVATNQIAKLGRFLQLRQEIQAAGRKSSMKGQVTEWKTERDALAAELGISKSMPTKDIQDIISGKVPLPAQQMSLDMTTGPLQETTTAANEAKEAIQELIAVEKEEATVKPTSSDADAYKEAAAAAEGAAESLKGLTAEERAYYLKPSSERDPNLGKWFADIRALQAEGAKASTEGIIGPSRDFARVLSEYNSTLTIPGTFAKEPPVMGFAGTDILSGVVKIPVGQTITEQLAAAIQKSLDSGEIDGNQLIHTLNDHLLALAKEAVQAQYEVRPGDKYDQIHADVKRESYIDNAAWARDLTSRLTIPEDTDIRHKRYAIEQGYERQLSNLQKEAKGAPILQYKLDSLNDWRDRELGMLDPDKAYDLALQQVERQIKNEDRYVPERRTSADAAFTAIEAVRAREEAAAEEAPASYLTDDLYPARATNAILEEVEARKADAAAAKEQAEAVQEANNTTETQAPIADETAKHEANTEAIKQETEAVKELNEAKQEGAAAGGGGNPPNNPPVGGGGRPPLILDPNLDVVAHQESSIPTLENSLYNVYSQGQMQTAEDIEAIIARLQQLGIATEEDKAKLMDLFNTESKQADFVTEYNRLIGTNVEGKYPVPQATGQYIESIKNNPMVNMRGDIPVSFKPEGLDKIPEEIQTVVNNAGPIKVEVKPEVKNDEPVKVKTEPEVKSSVPEQAPRSPMDIIMGIARNPTKVEPIVHDEGPRFDAQRTAEVEASDIQKLKQDYLELLALKRDAGDISGQESATLLSNLSELKSIAALKQAYEELKATKQEQPVDTHAQQVTACNELVDALVKVGAMTREAGEELKTSFDTTPTEQLIEKQKELQKTLDETKEKNTSNKTGQTLSAIGMGVTTLSGILGGLVGQTTLLGGAISGLGTSLGGILKFVGGLKTGSAMGWIMGLTTMITGIISLVQNFSLEKELERVSKQAEELTNKAKQTKAEAKNMESAISKVNELEKTKDESAAATEEYQQAVNDLAEKVPALVVGFNDAGDAIVDTTDAEALLQQARLESAKATVEATRAELEKNRLEQQQKVQETQKKLSEASLAATDTKGNATSTTEEEKYTNLTNIQTWLTNLRDNSSGAVQGAAISALASAEAAIQANAQGIDDYDYYINSIKEQFTKNGLDLGLEEYSGLNDLLNKDITLPEQITSGADYIEQIQNNLKAISELKDPTSKEADELVAQTASLLLQKQKFIDDLENPEVFKEIETSFHNLESQIGSLKGSKSLQKAQSRTLITAWQNAQQGINKSYKYLEDSAGATAIVTNAIWARFEEESEANIKAGGQGFALTDENIRIFDEDRTHAREYMDIFWSSLSDENRDLFNQMISDTEHYSAADFSKVFSGIFGFEQVEQMIIDYYTIGIQSIRDRLTNNLRVKSRDDEGRSKYGEDFIESYKSAIDQTKTTADESFLNTVLEGYSNLSDNGYTEDADTYQASAFDLWAELVKMSAEARNSFYKVLDQYGIKTKSDINNIIKSLENDDIPQNDAAIESLKGLRDSLHENISLAAQTIVSNFADKWKEESSNLSKLESGVDLADVEKILKSDAGKASGLTLDDFMMSGDKLILDQDKLDSYRENWLETQKGDFEFYATEIQAVSERYTKLFSKEKGQYNGPLNESAIEELKSIMGEDIVKNYMKEGEDGLFYIEKYDEFMLEFERSIKNANDAVDFGTKYFEAAQQMLNKTSQWNKGNYESLLTELGTDYQEELLSLTAYGTEYQGKDYANFDEVFAAVKNVRSAYDQLISDAISRGLDNIRFKDYKGLTGITESEISEYAENDNLVEFIKDYASRAGKALEEIDSLISQAVQKTTSKYTGIIEELVNYNTGDELSQVTSAALSELIVKNNEVENASISTLSAATAFLQTLAEQIGKAGYKLSDYNATAKSILDKTLFNQGGNAKALVDFASGDIGADALETLANNFGLQLDQLVDVETGQVLGVIGNRLSYNAASGNYEIQGTFDDFIAALENQFGITIDRTSKQYIESFKAFNDAKITKEHEIDKAVTEELKSIISLKPGESLNIAQTFTVLQSQMTEWWQNPAFSGMLKKMGAKLTDGILTIEQGADIKGIIQMIAQKAAEAGALLPEELDELNDALVQALRDITNIISSGIGGSISGEQKRTLTKWAADYGVTDLQFIETAEGYQLASESAKELYHTINAINSLQGQVVFEKLKDNLIETDERFKSINSTTGYIRELESKGLSTNDLETLSKLNGNVDMFNRPVLQNEDGTISTILAATEESRNYESDLNWVMNITPITPAGEKLENKDLYKYIQDLVDKSGGNMNKMIKLDKAQLGLIIEGENVELKNQEEIVKQYDLRAEKLHLIGEVIEKNKQASAEELALAQKMNEVRGLTEDNSFKFMDQDIPSGQKNPLNYFENWAKAYKAMKDTTRGGKSQKGKMAYQDFYNLITEMGNLEKITGKAIKIGKNVEVNAENVASLIEQAAGALEVQSDGSLKVNLSKIGVDFATGADTMNENVADGIKAVSQSQVKMLDSLIGLLEAIVTMEDAFKGMDVNSDAKLSIGELFEVDDESGEPTAFKDTWEKKLKDLRAMLDPKNLEKYNEDFARGMDSIKFTLNGKMMSLADVLKLDFEDIVGEGGIGADFYTKLMDSIYQAAQDGDFSETNVKEIIMQHLQEGLEDTGAQITFDLGNYTFIGTGSGNMQINWDTTAAEEAIKRHGKDKIIEAATKMLEGNAKTADIEMVLETKGILYLKNDKWTVKAPDGKEYTKDDAGKGYEEALSAAVLKDVEGVENIHMDAKGTGRALGTVTMGETTFNVTSENGQITYSDADNTVTGTSPRDVISQLVEKQLDEEEAGARMAGANYDREGRKIELTYQAEVKAGIASFELNSQSYANLDADIRKELEDALASGDRSKIDIAINAHPELKSLTGLTSSEIEEKIGIKEIPIKINGDVEEANDKLNELQKRVKDLTDPTYTIKVETTNATNAVAGTLAAISEKLSAIALKSTQNIEINTKYSTDGKAPTIPMGGKYTFTPTIGGADQSAQTGKGKAKGTLMGELGQELVVSNGRYFVVGQNGPEFVDLDTDAIVFNHLQTEQLLKHGMSNTRGKAVTNEQNAVAFAKGSLAGGPALASARAVLAQLKQLRAMWKSLGNTSAQDLAGLGGSGGGGGGGGNDKQAEKARQAWIEAVERWYDLMQEIAKLEKEITHEEALRTKLSSDWQKNGKAYYESQKRSLQAVEQQLIAQEALNIDKRDYFNQRRNQLNEYGAFKDWYQFDEQGQLKYNEGALGFLSDLVSRDANNVPKYSLEEQYNILLAQGYGAQMQYTSSGEQILPPEEKEGKETDYSDFYSKSIQAVWDQVESEKSEMQNLYDTIAEGEEKLLSLDNDRNEILEEIRNNQMELESKVLDAIVNQRQQAIDELEDQRKALEESTNKYIQGLTDALNKEKQMYENEQTEVEIAKLRRQIAILMRSGGSAAQINSLQDELRQKEQDQYFDYQQQQIDKIQEASDLELERLDTQISIMSETLDYEQEHGLLWNQVYDYLYNMQAPEIADLILQNDKDMWGASPLRYTQEFQDALFMADQWQAFRDDQNNQYDALYNKTPDGQTIADAVYGAPGYSDWKIFSNAMTMLYGDQWRAIADSMKGQFLQQYSKTGDITKATTDLISSLKAIGTELTSSIGSAFSSYSGNSSSSSGGSSSGSDNGGSSKTELGIGYRSNNAYTHQKYYYYSDGSEEMIDSAEPHTGGSTCSLCGQTGCYTSKSLNDDVDAVTGVDPRKKRASGGFVRHGIYELGERGVETVLTAEQTQVLRHNILSNTPNSLISLLKSYNEGYNGISDSTEAISQVNDNSVIIEQATVEMKIEQISSDYDARRAGEQALAEMMRIARKTSASNSIGR